MDNRHRYVLQCFIAYGMLSFDEVKKMLGCVKSRFPDLCTEEEINLRSFIQTINAAIAPFNLDIRKGIQEDNGAHYYILVNTVETPISRMTVQFQPNELEFFKKLVEHIVETEDGKIGSLHAVNLSEKLEKKMGGEEAERVLLKLQVENWITKSNEGEICLSVRTLVEMDQYLKEVFEGVIRLCYLCKNVCLLGESCNNCAVKIHRHCAKKLFEKQGDDQRCPSSDCRSSWGQIVINSQTD